MVSQKALIFMVLSKKAQTDIRMFLLMRHIVSVLRKISVMRNLHRFAGGKE